MNSLNISFTFLILCSFIAMSHSSVELEPTIYPGVQSGVLNVRFSSVYGPEFGLNNMRFDYKNNESWIACNLDRTQELIFGSPILRRFHKVATTRRISGDQHVTSFAVFYTVDGVNWKTPTFRNFFHVRVDSEVSEQVFTSSIYARAIKIVPIGYYNHMSSRFEVYISDDNRVIRQPVQSQIPVVSSGIARIRISAMYNNDWGLSKIYTTRDESNEITANALGCWFPAKDVLPQYAIFTVPFSTSWNAIATQGRKNTLARVTTYRLEYSNDLLTWNQVDNGRIFEGNTDSDSLVKRNFYTPVTARSIKYIPLSYDTQISARIELYIAGCNN